jgi:hypothetical protein
MLLHRPSRVDWQMSQSSSISSHLLTPRWTHAIDVRSVSRRDDTNTLAALGICLLAALRDQAVPMAPVPRADLPRRRTPARPTRSVPRQTPLSVPQEIESIPEQHAVPASS